MAKKRKDHNSPSGEAQSLKNAQTEIRPPAHVAIRQQDWPFWSGIISTRATDSWNEPDLVKAANLARCQADIERLILEVSDEGDVIKNDRGTPIVNPKHDLIERLSRREIALSRAIHVHAEATVGRSRDSGNRAKAQKSKVVAIENAGKNAAGLIPGL